MGSISVFGWKVYGEIPGILSRYFYIFGAQKFVLRDQLHLEASATDWKSIHIKSICSRKWSDFRKDTAICKKLGRWIKFKIMA
jgi:hypothetical protein